MRVLIIGSGGREHALAWKISQSPLLTDLYIAPGNAGTSDFGFNVDVNPLDFEEIKQFSLKNKIDMIIVGPEAPLVEGIGDFFRNDLMLQKIFIIGPTKQAAMLEGSKDFAKNFMKVHNIPTARHRTFDINTLENAVDFLKTMEPPYVIKADGLAAGKGVIICDRLEVAEREIREMILDSKFGKAGKKVVIEEFLEGIELSVFVLTDGTSYVMLPEAKDYKRIGEGDSGPNTGGMGSISPVPFATDEFMAKVEERIVKPTIDGLQSDGILYKGFIFFGLMNVNGDPYVIEYNARMGDPEAEAVMPRIKSDLLELFQAVGEEKLHAKSIRFDPRYCVAVMAVSGGYPGSYEKNKLITGYDKLEDVVTFFAGSRLDKGKIFTSGGRVLAVTGMADTMEGAMAKAYKEIDKIDFDKIYYRKDLGKDLLNYDNQ